MSFFKKVNIIFGAYGPLKDILKQEQELDLYQGRTTIVVKHETYLNFDETDLAINDEDEIYD